MSQVIRLLVVVLVALVLGACGGGAERSEFMAEGRDLFTDNGCSTCHGGRGQGGIGPSLARIGETFASCDDQVEWVRLGSERWLAERGDRYGDTGEEVRGGMPSFAESLDDIEIRTVVAYERIDFAGLDEAAVRADCGA